MRIALMIKKCLARAAVLGGLTTLGLVLTTGSVLAQDEELEEIVVTGSRIARDSNLSGALPVQTVGSEQIQMSGEFSLTDVVNDIPALLSSVTSESSIDAVAGFEDGTNVLNLRGLGSNRTLVLVDGRRHVGGLQGSSAVDIGSIPMKLVDRVEVLSGGASAIYGADAVTGVVNFLMKDDYEGFGIDVNYGISSEGDGQQTAITATWGTNFAGDRGNFAVSVDYRVDDGLTMGDRRGAQYGTGFDWDNPALRFQIGDISGSTPLFEQYYNYNNTGLIHYGLGIPSAADFVADYNLEFPGSPITVGDLNAAELELIQRGATAPQLAILPEATFPFTGGYGYVANGYVSQDGADFFGFDPDDPTDIDGNGVPDCQQSFSGYNSVFGNASFGAAGGCWHANADGSYNPVVDGLISGTFQGFGGDSYDVYRQDRFDFLLPDEKISVNLLGHFDITDSTSLFGEVKYVTQETDTSGDPNSFWDLIPGFADNPYLPPFLANIAQQTGGVAITPDPIYFNANRTTERETTRFVVGLEGEMDNGWGWEVAANYGRFEQDITRTNQLVIDRWFAALDATTDLNTGEPVCRSEIDALAPALNTPFRIPSYEAGYFTFVPGTGQCAPLDIWNGANGPSQAARDFVLVDTWDNLVIDQLVISAFMTGDSENWFSMPAGPIAFALGAEYRDESSDATFDPYQRGEIGPNANLPEGSNIADASANSSLVFRPQLSTKNEEGSYDVADIYGEVSIPLLADMPGARELTLDLAARFSDYSTIGQTTTWKANLVWAPIDSLSFRGSFSEAVRAPNITELFGPEVGLNFRPTDPCDANTIAAVAADDPILGQQIQDNCVTVFTGIGLDPFDPVTGAYDFQDPLSASFGGVVSGNELLDEETAETITVGFILQPEFAQGFSLTVDYWDISIDDAIQAVGSQEIVDGCYNGPTLNPNFCVLSERNTDPISAQFGGFNFLRQTTINFVKVESSGIDFSAKYAFEIGSHGFDATVQGTKVDNLDFFQNPLDPTAINPELGEVNRPELAGNILLNWYWGNLQVGWQTQYLDEQLLFGVEVETADALFGPVVTMDEYWQHDLSARYLLSDSMMFYGGVKNLTDEQPFVTNNAYPASPRGTFFFLGFDWQVN